MHLNKIMIADDHALTRKLLKRIINESWPHIEFIESKNGTEIIQQFEQGPDLLIMDYNVPGMNAYKVAEFLLKRKKNFRIILVTRFDELPILLNFLKIGVMGFITTGYEEEDILYAIQSVSLGDHHFHSKHESSIKKYLSNGISDRLPKIEFSPLELKIIYKITNGLTNHQIADSLQLSQRTVETYRYDLLRKTHVKNSFELINYIYRNGIAFEMDRLSG